MTDLLDISGADTLPPTLPTDATVLVAGTEPPSRHRVPLSVLRRYADTSDRAVVVTARADASETVDAYTSEDSDGPRISVVYTGSVRQSVSAPYGDVSTVFTPAPGDIERTAMAIDDLRSSASARDRSIHLVVRSLGPILAGTDVASARRVFAEMDRDGLTVLGLDYTKSSRSTFDAFADRVDAIAWVRSDPDGEPTIEFRRNRRR